MRKFNTAGPVRADKHYLIPPLERLNLAEVLGLIRDEAYFVLHAPRQTGKTSTLLALRDLLNGGSEGDYRCVYVNVEPAQTAREDVGTAMHTIIEEMTDQALRTLGGDAAAAVARSPDTSDNPYGVLGTFLARWAAADPQPLVLLIDEIDALVGDSLHSVLRQLRTGYVQRPEHFPASIVLCGLRNVRDYRFHAGSGNEMIAGGVPFNIVARSLRMDDFTEVEVHVLLGQHTAETGQAFAPGALDAVWEQTRGQPWLVNALAREMCFEHEQLRLRDRPLAEADVFEAREALILRRETHLDQLAEKLREPRVRRVIEPLLGGGDGEYSAHDSKYVRDLGLVAADFPLRIANPIYAEVLPRELTCLPREEMPPGTAWYIDADGGLNLDGLLAAFQDSFREKSEPWLARAQYAEGGPQLVLQAFLHRAVGVAGPNGRNRNSRNRNGRSPRAVGRIEREYALGSRRVDLLVIWPPETGSPGRFVVECKLLRANRERTVERGLAQTAAYMDLSDTDVGHLVIFDVREGRTWAERIFREDRAHDGKRITVWGM